MSRQKEVLYVENKTGGDFVGGHVVLEDIRHPMTANKRSMCNVSTIVSNMVIQLGSQ